VIPFRDRLGTGLLLADGAMGTMLLPHLQAGQCPEVLVLEKPDLLQSIAEQYLAAGADILQTNTFGASPLKLAAYGLAERMEDIVTQACRIVRGAVGDKAYVSGTCGPTGELLTPYGTRTPEELYETFRRQIACLATGGADLVSIETMTDLREARLAVQAAKAAAPGLPVMATMSFDKTPKGFYTIMGVSVAQAAEGLLEAGADVIGANCGQGMDNMVLLAEAFRHITKAPLAFQANAGLPVQKGDTLVYEETPRVYAQKARALKDLGAAVIGGCCGTTPEHIRVLREMLCDPLGPPEP